MRFYEFQGVMRKLIADIGSWKIALGILIGLTDYIFPSVALKSAAAWTFGLIMLDMATGVVASHRSNVQISSARMAGTLDKVLCYGSVLLVSIGVSNGIPGMKETGEVATTSLLTVMLLREGISVLENVRKIKKGLSFAWLENMLKERERSVEAPKISGARPDGDK